MKILVICQYYYPEPFRLSDICEELVKRGNDVTVVTGIPNYPMGEIYDGYQNGEKRDEVINGVKVHRCAMIPRKHGPIYRILNYFSYAHSSTRYVKKLDGDFDVVFVNQLSPVMMANAGIKYKKKYGTKLVLYCLDLWPASLTVGGIKQGSLMYKCFHRLSKNIYCQADTILISSMSFARYFEQEFNISDTEYLPQYAESLFTVEQCKKIPNGKIDLMFAGNVGTAQSVETIIKAAALTKDITNLRWHIVGDGSDLENCKKLAHQLQVDNGIVNFYGRKPLEEMPRYYAMADAMLVTMQKNPVLSMTLPGKVQTYMAAGKPIIGAIGGETQEVISKAKCGVCIESNNIMEMAEEVRSIMNSDIYGMKTNSIKYFDEHFSKESFMKKINLVFLKCTRHIER